MRRTVLFTLVLFSAVNAWSAEDAAPTPSDQMKKAVDKLNKTPATIGRTLQDLAESAKEKLRQTLGGKAGDESSQAAPELKTPAKSPQEPAPSVDIRKEGGRDPFRPMTQQTRTQSRPRENLSPLERLELSQVKLVGIVWDIKEPRAMVEDNGGLGYTIKVGTPIGNNDGKVKAIHRNQVVIEETFFDVTGTRKKHEVSLKLATD